MHRPKFFAAIFVSVFWSILAQAQTLAQDQIRAKAVEMAGDFQTAKYDKMVDFMYPKIVELAGGKEQMLTLLKTGMDETARAGFKFTAMDIGQAGVPVSAGDKLFSIVPQTVHLAGPKAKFEQTSFLLAVSTDQGKTWSFLDGTGLNPDVMKKLFPDFPATLKLPERPQPKIVPAL